MAIVLFYGLGLKLWYN